MTQNEQDAIDARRWRAIRLRHPATLCRMAIGGASFSSVKAPALIDAWGDMVAAEVEAFDYDHWKSVELPQIVTDAARDSCETKVSVVDLGVGWMCKYKADQLTTNMLIAMLSRVSGVDQPTIARKLANASS